MPIGREQIYHPSYSVLEKTYIALFGVPIIGLRIRARNIFSLIPENRNYRNILDAGSGPGIFSFELARKFPNSEILGIDLLDEEIEASNVISGRAGFSNVRFQKGSVLEVPKQDFFDLIVCVDIMEHIDEDCAALKALYRTTAPDGLLVLHVPALNRRYPIWKKSPNFYVETHVRTGYEPEEIYTKVQEAGYYISESGFTYGFWETLANNLSYMITGAKKKNKLLYAMAFPVLLMISLLGVRARPQTLGAGVYVVAVKKTSEKNL
jgi:2-polyprenyl-3-methyl-5-hydroxy-6-metoxy-1,4-benzoquinol methylase